MNTQHIPAWKRLGLKLKQANEKTSTTDNSAVSSGGARKRKELSDPNGSVDKPHQLKKIHNGSKPSSAKLNQRHDQRASGTTGDKEQKPRKSVTFATDTKSEDGNPTQTIQSQVPDSKASTQSEASEAAEVGQTQLSLKKPKKEKKAKSTRPSAQQSPRKATAALAYLDGFHRQRHLWKFNKNHETWIIKHSLSTEHIPPQENFALASYLQGLKSTGAKQRLIDQSCEALGGADAFVPTNDELRQKFQDALTMDPDEQIDDKEQPTWLHDIERPRLVLLSLGHEIRREQRQTLLDAKNTPRTKKTKLRTSRIEIESSSSSDSESLEDESEHGASDMGSNVGASRKAALTGQITTGIDTTSDSDLGSESQSETSDESSTEGDSDLSSDSN